MTYSKISCLACGGELITCNLPVRCACDGVRWTRMLRYYGCLSCGRYAAAAQEVGERTSVQTAGETDIRLVYGKPYRAG